LSASEEAKWGRVLTHRLILINAPPLPPGGKMMGFGA